MGLKRLPEDEFEDMYTAKFSAMAARYGVTVKYERDRAGIDIGVHLCASDELTNIRVWFQLKGKHAETLSLENSQKSSSVSVSIGIAHLQHWYQSPEPVYLVVYVESADTFLAQDVKTLIDEQWGSEILHPALFPSSQEFNDHQDACFLCPFTYCMAADV